MKNSIISFLLKNKGALALISLFAIFAIGSGAQHLKMSADYEVWFSDDNPEYKDFMEIQKTFTKADNVVMLIIPKHKGVFSKETLKSVEYLTEKSWEVPFSTRVDSISNFQYSYAEEDDLIVRNLYKDADSLSVDKIAEIKEVAMNEPELLGRGISKNGEMTAINITINLPKGDPEGSPKVVKYVRELADEAESLNPDIKIQITGLVAMDNAFIEVAMADMSKINSVMFLVILICLGFLLKSGRAVGMIVSLITLSVVVAMGVAGWTGVEITPVSASAPTILTTIVIANCVHIILTMMNLLSKGYEKEQAIRSSLESNIKPVMLASMTTMVGFLTMHFSDVPPFHDLANMVASGVFSAFLISFTILPWMLATFSIKSQKKKMKYNKISSSLAELVIKKRGMVFIVSMICVVGLGSLVQKNVINDRIWEFFGKSVEFRQATDLASENLTGPYYIYYGIDTGEKYGITDPEYLNKLDGFKDWLYEQEEVVHVSTISDTMKRLNRDLNFNDPAYYKIPEDKEMASQYLLLYEMSLPYGLDLNTQIDLEKSQNKVTAFLRNVSNNEMIAFNKRAVSWLDSNMSGNKITLGSPQYMFSHISLRSAEQMAYGVFFALSLISILISISLKSFKMGVVSLIPNVIPPIMAFGIWGLLIGEVGFALALSVSMIIGIIVDDTVHFLSKYTDMRKSGKMSPENAIRATFEQVGPALMITTIALVIGFSLLMFSNFKLNFELGLITSMTISIALIIDLLLLPAIILMVDKGDKEENVS